MKIIINETNKISDEPLNVAMRLINKGKAHLPAQSGLIPAGFSSDLIPLHNDGDVILNSKQQEALKKFIDKSFKDLPNKDFSNKPNRDKPVEITFEDLDDIAIFREPDVTEVDVIEPIPIDHYVDFESPKKMSLLKKLRNKII